MLIHIVEPASRTELQELEAKVDDLQSKIDQTMGEMGMSEEKKLRRTIGELEFVYQALQREAGRASFKA